jgi:hypothetical protein
LASTERQRSNHGSYRTGDGQQGGGRRDDRPAHRTRRGRRHRRSGIQIGTSGKWILALGHDGRARRRPYIATRTVLAGEALTGIRQGVMDGFDLSGLAYNAPGVPVGYRWWCRRRRRHRRDIIGYVGPGLGAAARYGR